MERIETTLKSDHDGLALGLSIFIPEHPRGILQLVHGMAEHRERYYDFMEYCAKQGYIVAIHDHRGHGASVKSADDYGYFYADGAEAIVEDVYQVNRYLRERHTNLPLALFGHSMGSLVVRCYMQQYDQTVNGLIVCGSPSQRFGAKLGLLSVKLVKALKGDRYRSPFINHLLFGSYNQKFGEVTSPNSWIVSDPAVVAAYDDDPRDGFIFTTNGFEALLNLASRAYTKTGWQMRNTGAPIFFIAGADDPCIIDEKHFTKAVDFMRQRGYVDVMSKLYPGMRHEILNEVGKAEVWQDVVDWCNTKVFSR